MKEIRIVLMIMAFVFSSNSCDKETLEDDELTLNKIPYTGNQLRIDGYYYLLDDYGINATYFFYRNGVIIHRGG